MQIRNTTLTINPSFQLANKTRNKISHSIIIFGKYFTLDTASPLWDNDIDLPQLKNLFDPCGPVISHPHTSWIETFAERRRSTN